MFLDTGHGWGVAVSSDTSAEHYASLPLSDPRARPSPAQRVLHLVTGTVRAFFNLIVVLFVVAVIGVSVLLGLERLGQVRVSETRQAPVATARPIPTAYPGAQTYTSALYSLAVPLAWTRTAASHTVPTWGTAHDDHFADPTSTSTALVVSTLPVVSADHLQDALDASMPGVLQGHGSNFEALSAPQTVTTLDGRAETEESFTFTWTVGLQSTTLRGLALITSQGLSTYLVVAYAPPDIFAQVQAQTFTPILASFRFVP
jgi:hypothetical protein